MKKIPLRARRARAARENVLRLISNVQCKKIITAPIAIIAKYIFIFIVQKDTWLGINGYTEERLFITDSIGGFPIEIELQIGKLITYTLAISIVLL